MSQVADYSIANASGATVRADLNNVLAAIASANSGTAEPTTMYPFMIWVDTTNNIIKLRNGANDAWLTLPIAMNASNTAPSNLNVLGNLGIGSATTPAELIHGIASSGDANIRMEGTAVRLKKSGEDFIVYDGSILKFETGGTEAARFDGNQQLGIGTASPTEALSISSSDGLISATSTTAKTSGVLTGGYVIYSGDGSGPGAGNRAGIQSYATNGVGSTYDLRFYTSDGSTNFNESMRIDSSGTLTTPAGVDFNIMSTSGMTLGSTTSITVFKTNNTEVMRITSDGLVGINTNDPQAPLHARNGSSGVTSYIAGTRAIIEGTDTTYLTIASPTTSIKGILFADSDDSDAGYITYDPNDNLDFGTAGSTRMRITDGGALLVGTTSTTIGTSNF